MIVPGLCSISYRGKSVDEIIALTVKAGLEAVEWGGDVHVPHGDLPLAREVRDKTLDAGLRIASYGSYYRAGRAAAGQTKPVFEDVAASAKALGASTIRIWAGYCNREEADDSLVRELLEDVRRCAGIAAGEGMSLSFEYHGNTFTNTDRNAQLLASELPGENIRFYWQPPHHNRDSENLAGLLFLMDRITHVHVFQWVLQKDGSLDRRLLEEGRERWASFLAPFAGREGETFAYLEFSRGDDPANLLRDGAVLREILASL